MEAHVELVERTTRTTKVRLYIAGERVPVKRYGSASLTEPTFTGWVNVEVTERQGKSPFGHLEPGERYELVLRSANEKPAVEEVA